MAKAEIIPQIQVVISASSNISTESTTESHAQPIDNITKPERLPLLTNLHAGYFIICLSLGAQVLLWKSLSEPKKDSQAVWHAFPILLSNAFVLVWCLAMIATTTLSCLYILRCFLHFDMVRTEFSHHIEVNYMYAPWISWLLMLQSAPTIVPRTSCHQILCMIFSFPILLLDIKLYGQWFTTKRRFLSKSANPVSLISVIGNLVAAQVTAEMGWRESAVSLFSLGLAHYLILFVTLYQHLTSCIQFPRTQRPAYYLFFAAPGIASLAWKSISGAFDTSSKMLFFLSLFLFMSLACRPVLFKKSMKRLTVIWWNYSLSLTYFALASGEYAQAVKGSIASGLMRAICMLSALVFIGLLLTTMYKMKRLLYRTDASIMSCSTDLEAVNEIFH